LFHLDRVISPFRSVRVVRVDAGGRDPVEIPALDRPSINRLPPQGRQRGGDRVEFDL
jgi:hypothetical protein